MEKAKENTDKTNYAALFILSRFSLLYDVRSGRKKLGGL